MLDGVSVAYGKRRALDGVSLVVEAGEIVTLLGANGSGKSTTLRAISGLVRPSAGRIVLDGRDITRAARWRTASSGRSPSSRSWASGRGSSRARSRGASSRCWPSRAR